MSQCTASILSFTKNVRWALSMYLSAMCFSMPIRSISKTTVFGFKEQNHCLWIQREKELAIKMALRQGCDSNCYVQSTTNDVNLNRKKKKLCSWVHNNLTVTTLKSAHHYTHKKNFRTCVLAFLFLCLHFFL